ncbi:hypothetical protein E1193_15070 [Micromonospora sp. KC606]|uniref:hypothetical protein n=1 Tax=Micromonospora sp. KC606 TaxID=2530379 RepID=UPI001052B2ED|nr:hypothetical protein [Micromonospora sp. KC606]TDC81353.1 hypothetical protein E1193_15070 [Micromonospora sp. KC606]
MSSVNRWEAVLGVILGLLVNEITDISPWIARRLVRWSAYRWTTDPEIAAGYAEEWEALIDDRPGKLFKLLTAVRFSLGAAGRAAPQLARHIKAHILLILGLRKARSPYQLIRATYAGIGAGKKR